MTERLSTNQLAILTSVTSDPGHLTGEYGRQVGLSLNAAWRAVESLRRRYLIVVADDGRIYPIGERKSS